MGAPGSGKTTWSKEFLSKNPSWVKIGRDDFRFMLRNQPVLEFKEEVLVTDLVFTTAQKALSKGFNVILDNTHCRKSYINQVVEALGEFADIEFMYFECSIEKCIERDLVREKRVGELVIRKMFKDLTIMLDSFDFTTIKKRKRKRIDYSLAWKKDLPNAIICDIDGTLAHMGNHRGPFDWKKVGLDDPDYPIIEAMKAWKNYGTKIILASGRDGSCREETIEWLKAADVPFDELFMRPVNDFRKDSIIKKEIFENEIKDKYNVIMVYDDRDQVVELWRSLGLKCAQVEPGMF